MGEHSRRGDSKFKDGKEASGAEGIGGGVGDEVREITEPDWAAPGGALEDHWEKEGRSGGLYAED